ncbi:restriction endonuclease subunit S [Candidatus Saccharibacteria bacterium]|nr:restriction endonuclease subunit S [Candidatus Saccharibacteria bacterium]
MTQAVLLGDIISDIAMGPFGSNLKVDSFTDSGVPIIKGGNLYDHEVGGSFSFVSEEKAQSLKRSLAYPDDIVITHRGTLGQISIVPHGKYPYYLASQSQLRITPDKSQVNPRYLLYYLRSKVGQHELMQHTSQVGVPSIATPTRAVKSLNVLLPGLLEQGGIVDILGAFDQKIELNRQMNETLEQMGQTLFRHYFIDNPEAKKWEEKSLDEIADFLNGLAMQKYPKKDGEPTLPVIKIREMSSGVTANTDVAGANIPEQYIVHNGDLLFSWSGTLLVKFWAEGYGALNQHLFKVTSKKYPEWLYYYWTKYHLDDFIQTAKSKATTMGHIQRRHLKAAKVRVPDNASMKKIGRQIQPLIDDYKNNSEQIQTLTTLRDALLPRLISGKIKL